MSLQTHGVGMSIAPSKNRKGRKRKSGRRQPDGRLARISLDYRAMAAFNPDRADLPAAYRLDERAGTCLGRLNIVYRISDSRKANAGHSEKFGITEVQYQAGQKYARIVGAYLAQAGSPRCTAGTGRSHSCRGDANCPPETCICRMQTEDYMRANEAIERDAGRAGHMAVNRVAIHDQPISADQLPPLRMALTALARHLGLTNKGKSRHG